MPSMKHLSALLAALLLSTAACAESAAPPPMPQRWWTASSLSGETVSDQWLWHLDGAYSIADSSGNVDMTSKTLGFLGVVRKWRFTNYLQASNQHVSYEVAGRPGIVEYKIYSYYDSLHFDVTKQLYLLLGARLGKNETQGIDRQQTYFGGAGFRILDEPGYGLKVAAVTGRESVEYAVPGFDKDNGMWMVVQDARFQLAPYLQFTEHADYSAAYKDSEEYTWNATLALEVSLWEHISLELARNYAYVNRPPFAPEKQDVNTMLSVKVSL